MMNRLVCLGLATIALAGCAREDWEGFGDRAARAAAIHNAGMPGAQGYSGGTPPPPQQVRPARFFVRSFVSGLNRVCVYNSMGSEVYETIPATSICPLN